jgi:maleate cis-trans isomerase
LGVYVARARVAGPWKRPLPEMAEEIATSAQLLSDVSPDLIVFHCTDTSMTQGPRGEGRILDIVTDATGIPAVATSRLVLEALQTLGLKKVVLLTPYLSNKAIVDYLAATGPRRRPRHRARPQCAGIRQGHAGRMGRACSPA